MLLLTLYFTLREPNLQAPCSSPLSFASVQLSCSIVSCIYVDAGPKENVSGVKILWSELLEVCEVKRTNGCAIAF